MRGRSRFSLFPGRGDRERTRRQRAVKEINRNEVNGEMVDREGLSEAVTLELTLGGKGVSRSKSREHCRP